MISATLKLDSPITEEQWDKITDVNLDHSEYICFHTKNGKRVIYKKQKKGKWILANGKTRINCSRCYHCSWSLSFEDTVRQFNYCPNCGADMRGDDQ